MGNNKYIITKIKCWPVFKQDPNSVRFTLEFILLRARKRWFASVRDGQVRSLAINGVYI